MIMDKELLLADTQAFAADAGTTNVYDLGVGINLGDGEPMALCISVDVAADFTTTDETYAVDIQTDDNAAFASPTSVVKVTITAAKLVVGALLTMPIPYGATFERYLRAFVDVGGTTPSVTLTIFLQPVSMIDKRKDYADAITIS